MAKRNIDRLIEGLEIIRDKVHCASFYNSSGGDASFRCDGLTPEEQDRLKSLGWTDVSVDGCHFSEWADR